MPKARKAGLSNPSEKKKRLWQGVLVVGVLAAVIGAYVLRNQGSSNDAASGKLADTLGSGAALPGRLVIPATPENPRPVTLNPEAFTDPEVKAAYQAAKDVPEALEHMACYCGCFASAGHHNNLDCFHDSHGAT